MHVYLHIGCEKTGTTTVQSWCARNRAALHRRGILYPASLGAANHLRLPCFVAAHGQVNDLRRIERIHDADAFSRFREDLPARFAHEVADSGVEKILVSNEHLSARIRTEEEVLSLRALLEAACGATARFTVIHYVRRQDDMLYSLYSTAVKAGSTAPFRLPGNTHDWRLNPLKVLDLWSRVFGQENVRLRVFDRGRLRHGDIVADLMDLLGVDVAAERSAFRSVPERNARLAPDALEFMRLMNKAVPAFLDNSVSPDRNMLIEALESVPGLPQLPLVAAEELRAFREGFEPINKEVARRYLGREDGVLFDAPAPAAEEKPVWQGLSAETAVRIAAHLWVTQRQTLLPADEGADRRPAPLAKRPPAAAA